MEGDVRVGLGEDSCALSWWESLSEEEKIIALEWLQEGEE